MKYTLGSLKTVCTIGAFTAALAYAPVGLSQSQPEETNDETPGETIEEITVYGERSIIILRKELELAQENMFVVFNDLNSTDEFDIECDYEQRLDTRRWVHVCTPKFATRQPAHEGAGFLTRNKRDGRVYSVTHHNLRMNKKLWTEMATLINENAELRSAFTDLAAARNALEAEQQRRQGD